jgi:hypothetical protein
MVLGLFVTLSTGALICGLVFILVNVTLSDLRRASSPSGTVGFDGVLVVVIALLVWVLVTAFKVAVDSIRDIGQRTTVEGMVFHFLRPDQPTSWDQGASSRGLRSTSGGAGAWPLTKTG